MAKTITQRITFRNTKSEMLYEMFLDSKKHGLLTGGGSAKISRKVGAPFSVHNGYVTGRNLPLEKGKLIVQSWFGSDWAKGTHDSTFIILFEQEGKDVILNMTHANLPDKHADSIRKGWPEYYWKPWKKYMASIKQS